MRKVGYVTFLSILALAPAMARASQFDGSQPLICASLVAVGCGADGECDSGTAESVNLPEFFRINFAGKAVIGHRADGTTVETAIQRLEQGDGQVHLQGMEGERSWTAALSEETGRFTLAVSGNRVGFLVFGACIPAAQ